jgi:spore maturation protein B
MTFYTFTNTLSNAIFLLFVAGIPLYGFLRKVAVYDTFIEGAKEGFQTTLHIIPYLVAMIVALGMFRASGALDLLAKALQPIMVKIGMPVDLLPLVLIRPFSGSAANGMLAELIHKHGGDSFIAHVAATIIGSTETTFYIIAVYFGVVNIKRTRHAIAAGLLADLAGVLASLWICQLLFNQYT